jgi:hypothetical protein
MRLRPATSERIPRLAFGSLGMTIFSLGRMTSY